MNRKFGTYINNSFIMLFPLSSSFFFSIAHILTNSKLNIILQKYNFLTMVKEQERQYFVNRIRESKRKDFGKFLNFFHVVKLLICNKYHSFHK